MAYKNMILSIGIICSSLLFIGCEDKKVETAQKEEKVEKIKPKVKKVEVEVHTVKKQTYPIWVDFTGKTQAVEQVSITSRISGEIQEIYFKAGQEVKKGDKLFKIDDKSNKNTLLQKKSTLSKDQASLNLAIANLRRYEPLVKKGLAPREKLDELKANVAQYQAIVRADKAALKDAKLDLSHTIVRATINGVIGKSLFDMGSIVSTSDKLASIVQSKQLYVNFNPSSTNVFLLKQYKSEEFPKVKVLPENVQNESLSLDGRIDFIDSVADETTGTVALRAKIDNKKGLLFPGSFVNIKLFVTDKIPFIALNPNNLSQDQLGSYVYIVDKDSKIQKRQVVVEYSNKELAIIQKGLQDGDKVVVSALNRLKNNLEVKTIEVANPVKL